MFKNIFLRKRKNKKKEERETLVKGFVREQRTPHDEDPQSFLEKYEKNRNMNVLNLIKINKTLKVKISEVNDIKQLNN